MKQKELMKQVVPLDLEGLEVLEGELLFVTGGAGGFWDPDNGTGCKCSNGWGCGCDHGWGCNCSNGVGCNCSGGTDCGCSRG